MSGSAIIFVPAGVVSTPFQLGPLQSACIGPQVQGGTVTVESAPSLAGPYTALQTASLLVASFRPTVNTYFRVTAAVQQALIHITDMGGSNQPTIDELSMNGAAFASSNSTAEQVLFSLRIPPLFLPPIFRLEVDGNVAYTASATAKTLQVRLNGLTGTLIHQSPAIGGGTNANYNFRAIGVGDGTGQNIKGFGSGAATAGGWGISTTAYTALARDYINNETELVVTCTKATGTDVFTLEGVCVHLY